MFKWFSFWDKFYYLFIGAVRFISNCYFSCGIVCIEKIWSLKNELQFSTVHIYFIAKLLIDELSGIETVKCKINDISMLFCDGVCAIEGEWIALIVVVILNTRIVIYSKIEGCIIIHHKSYSVSILPLWCVFFVIYLELECRRRKIR